MLDLHDRIPWFFKGTTPDIDINEWIIEQNKRTKSSYLKYSTMNPYKLDVIEKIKDAHIWTLPLLVGNYSALTGIFDWNGTILTMSVSQYNDEWICFASIHANSSSKLFDFIRVFAAYEIDMDESKKTGFGN